MAQITHKDGFGVFTVGVKSCRRERKSERDGEREREGKGEDESVLHIYKESATMTSLYEAVHYTFTTFIHFRSLRSMLMLNFCISITAL